MYWYRFSRFDRFLIMSSAIGLILSTFFIFEDRWIYKLLTSDARSRERIGAVKTAVNDVRQRHGNTFSWVPLESSADVYQGDSIFTGNQSEAMIITDGGEKISISPNSLVVINSKVDSIRLDIDYGSVLGEVGKNKTLLIASGGDVTEFKGDEAIVKVEVNQGQKIVVNVIEGQVEVTSDDGQRILGQKEKAEISASGTIVSANDVRLELLTPAPERIVKPAEARDLVLTWRSNYQFSDYTIEIARDVDFTTVITKERSAQPLFRPPVLPTNERIFWRVSAQLHAGQPTVLSVTSAFVLAEDKSPEVIFPRDNMRLSFEEQAEDESQTVHVIARWQPRSASANWEAQVSSSPDFAQNLKTFATKDVFANLGPLPEGAYFVRARATDWIDANWSDTLAFVIVRKSSATFRPPQLVTAEEDFQLITNYAGYKLSDLAEVNPDKITPFVEGVPELSWNSVPGATSYEVEIADDGDFKNIVKRTEVSGSRYAWEGVRLGDFHWRIRAVSTGNRRGPYTEPHRLNVSLAPPHTLIPEQIREEVTDLAQMESAPPPFLLRWSPTLFAAHYELEFDKDPKLGKAMRITTQNPFKKVQAPIAGIYFWRVRAMDTTSKPLTEWSETHRHQYERVYLRPETTKELKALFPNNETIMMIGQGEIKIHFRWVTPIKNGRYRFQLSSAPDFQSTRKDLLIDKDFFLLREELAGGCYYWRIRVESEKFTSPWTAAYKFQIQHESSPFNFEVSERKKEQELRKFEVKKAKDLAEYNRKVQANSAEMARLNLESLPQLNAPTDLTAPESFQLTTRPISGNIRQVEQIPDREQYALLTEVPSFEWAPVSDAVEYHVEIAEDSDFKHIVDRVKTNRPSFSWLQARPGGFHWRVRAEAKDRRDSAMSETSWFELGVREPSYYTPHAIFIRATDETRVALLRWASVAFAHSYEVEFSEYPDFSKKTSSVTSGPRLNQSVAKEGVYYWRVRPLGTNKKALRGFTEPRLLNISFGVAKDEANPSRTPAAKAPELQFPSDAQTLFIPTTEVPRIAFTWNAPTFNGVFVLEIAKDPDFSEIVQRLNSKTNIVVAEAPPNNGVLYWRLLTAVNGRVTWRSPGRQIKFSNPPSRQTATQQKIPTQLSPNRAK